MLSIFIFAILLGFIVTYLKTENFISTGALIQLETSRPTRYVITVPANEL